MALLDSLKINLGITSSAYDARLGDLILAAQEMIAREGVTLNPDNYEDAEIVIMYAAYLWRRRDSAEGMPRMLRWALNNRLFSQKMQVTGND